MESSIAVKADEETYLLNLINSEPPPYPSTVEIIPSIDYLVAKQESNKKREGSEKEAERFIKAKDPLEVVDAINSYLASTATNFHDNKNKTMGEGKEGKTKSERIMIAAQDQKYKTNTNAYRTTGFKTLTLHDFMDQVHTSPKQNVTKELTDNNIENIGMLGEFRQISSVGERTFGNIYIYIYVSN